MSATLWHDADIAGAGRAATPSAEPAPRRASPTRRRLVVTAVVGALVVAALLLSWGRGPAPTTLPYDPDNPAFNGAQALARVLAAQGVDVVVARGQEALRSASVDSDTTVVVSYSTPLRDATVSALASLTRSAERVVLVRPERRVVRQLAPEVSVRDAYREGLVSSCANSDVREGETLSASQAEYLYRAPTEACFLTDAYAVYLQLPASGQHGPLLLLGSTDLVTNERIAQDANAAVALRSLGHSSRLVWYVPDVLDAPVSSRDQTEAFFPDWLGPMVLLGAFAVFAVMLWRGRRLGRLVTEPLPVVIRAIETTESRGRLYRKARDATQASTVLREGTRRRLTAYLGLPSSSSPDAVISAVAEAAGRPGDVVRWLLFGPPPSNDADLLGLAVQLSDLEKGTRRP